MAKTNVSVLGIELRPVAAIDYTKVSVVFKDELGNRRKTSITISEMDHRCLKLLAARNDTTVAKLLGALDTANDALAHGRGHLSHTVRQFVAQAMRRDPSLHKILDNIYAPALVPKSAPLMQAAE